MSPRRPARSGPSTAALAVLFVAAAAGCGEPDATEDGRRPVPGPRDDASTTVTPARFATEVAFAPHGRGPIAYLRLEQVARPGALVRRYRAWLGDGSGVRPVLAVRDTLPVPRAAWRPLPAEGLRLTVGRDGRLRSLTLGPPDGSLRLAVDSTLADWTGRTGQPERLAAGRAVRGEDTVSGLLLERRRARPLDTPAPPGDAGLLLAAGPGPVGVAVLLGAAEGDSLPTAAAAHGLVDGAVRSWSSVRLRAGSERPGVWELELGEAGTLLRIRPAAGPDPLPSAVAGSLAAGSGERAVTGVRVGGAGG